MCSDRFWICFWWFSPCWFVGKFLDKVVFKTGDIWDIMFVFCSFLFKKEMIQKTHPPLTLTPWNLRCRLQVPVVRLHTEPVGVPASFGGGGTQRALEEVSSIKKWWYLTYEAITSAIFAKTLNFDGDVFFKQKLAKGTCNNKPET